MMIGTNDEDSSLFIRDHWNLGGFSPNPLTQLELNMAKVCLKWWNHNIFGNVHLNIKDIKNKFTQQTLKLQDAWGIDGDIEYKKLMALYHRALNKEELFSKEKAGDKVISDSNRKIASFNTKVRACRRQSISKLLRYEDPKDWTKNLPNIHSIAISHFEKLLTSEVYNLGENSLCSSPHNACLIQPTMEEVHRAFFSMAPDNTPSPYCLTAFFY